MNGVTLRGVEIFRSGRWNGVEHDDFDTRQLCSTFAFVRDHLQDAKVLGYRGDGVVPVIINHDESDQVGRVIALDVNALGVLVGDLEVSAAAADAIKSGEIVAVSAAMSFRELRARRLAHVALLRAGDEPAVFGLKPIKECLPKEYVT